MKIESGKFYKTRGGIISECAGPVSKTIKIFKDGDTIPLAAKHIHSDFVARSEKAPGLGFPPGESRTMCHWYEVEVI